MNLDLLNKIKAVDPPPFLLTRIEQRIENLQTQYFPKKIVWRVTMAILVICMLNIGALVYQSKMNNATKIEIVAAELLPNNNLYK